MIILLKLNNKLTLKKNKITSAEEFYLRFKVSIEFISIEFLSDNFNYLVVQNYYIAETYKQ